ncbi:hypothetical protein MKEN_01049700 [Mycena kentingensis (nom. inval.)]|nr:hypothetical protein MKEN_01049700 [Mycena kentingensis (nom. inval.)]
MISTRLSLRPLRRYAHSLSNPSPPDPLLRLPKREIIALIHAQRAKCELELLELSILEKVKRTETKKVSHEDLVEGIRNLEQRVGKHKGELAQLQDTLRKQKGELSHLQATLGKQKGELAQLRVTLDRHEAELAYLNVFSRLALRTIEPIILKTAMVEFVFVIIIQHTIVAISATSLAPPENSSTTSISAAPTGTSPATQAAAAAPLDALDLCLEYVNFKLGNQEASRRRSDFIQTGGNWDEIMVLLGTCAMVKTSASRENFHSRPYANLDAIVQELLPNEGQSLLGLDTAILTRPGPLRAHRNRAAQEITLEAIVSLGQRRMLEQPPKPAWVALLKLWEKMTGRQDFKLDDLVDSQRKIILYHHSEPEE